MSHTIFRDHVLVRCRCGHGFKGTAPDGVSYIVPGQTWFCPGCGHAMVYDGVDARDFTDDELANPTNADQVRQCQADQDAYCHARGWWG